MITNELKKIARFIIPLDICAALCAVFNHQWDAASVFLILALMLGWSASEDV